MITTGVRSRSAATAEHPQQSKKAGKGNTRTARSSAKQTNFDIVDEYLQTRGTYQNRPLLNRALDELYQIADHETERAKAGRIVDEHSRVRRITELVNNLPVAGKTAAVIDLFRLVNTIKNPEIKSLAVLGMRSYFHVGEGSGGNASASE